MPALQRLRWIGLISANVISLNLLMACHGPHPPRTAMTDLNTQDSGGQEALPEDACAPLRSPVVSVVDWMNCVGAALGAPRPGEVRDSSPAVYSARTRP
jgi:hypothetical protein